MDGVWVQFAMRRDEKRRDGKLVEATVKGWSSLDNRTVSVRIDVSDGDGVGEKR